MDNKLSGELKKFVRHPSLSTVTYVRRIIETKAQYIYYKARYGSSSPDPFETIMVNPTNIEYMVVPAFDYTRKSHKTYVLGGDWDKRHTTEQIGIHRGKCQSRKLIRVDNYDFYNSLSRHFNEGVPWEETMFYEWAMNKARKNNIGVHYDSKEAINNRLKEIDQLYESIQTDGYLSQEELNCPFPSAREVQVNIGRQGEILFDEGKHRFVISKILGLKRIPVKVFVRHKEWQKARQEASKATDTGQLGKVARANMDHPDMKNVGLGMSRRESK